MSLVEVVGVCVARVVVVVLVFVVFDFVVFCIFIMMTKTETRAAAMTAPLGIVDDHLVVAGEVTFLDTLLPEAQPETISPSQPETISPRQPEEMPSLAPPSAEGGGDMPPPKTPTPPPKAPALTTNKRWQGRLPSEPVAKAGGPPERLEPLSESHKWEAMNAVIKIKNEELRDKENIIKSTGQELKENNQELEDKEIIIKSMGQIIKDRDGIIKHTNQELRIKNESIRAINEEFEQQQAQVGVWEQEVTIDDMVIGVVVRKKRRIIVDTS